MSQFRKIAVYIDPPSHHFLGDRLFDIDDGSFHSVQGRAPYVALRQFLDARGVAVHTADFLADQTAAVQNVYVSMGYRRHYRRLARRRDTILSGFFVMEPPIVDPGLYRELHQIQRYFRRVFHWSDSASLEPFVDASIRCSPFRWPQAYEDVQESVWARTDRKFLVMINVNKLPRLRHQELFTERLRAVEFFSRSGEIDLYGANWDGPPYKTGSPWMPGIARRAQRALQRGWLRIHPDPLLTAARRVYKGRVPSKLETLGQYTFALCFENMVLKGWVTEKVFDCFFAGTVPIYWGAPDIETYVPPECFIDMRRFSGYAELSDFLKSLSGVEINRYKENARAYLKSPQFQPFTKEAFIRLFSRMIEEDLGVPLN